MSAPTLETAAQEARDAESALLAANARYAASGAEADWSKVSAAESNVKRAHVRLAGLERIEAEQRQAAASARAAELQAEYDALAADTTEERFAQAARPIADRVAKAEAMLAEALADRDRIGREAFARFQRMETIAAELGRPRPPETFRSADVATGLVIRDAVRAQVDRRARKDGDAIAKNWRAHEWLRWTAGR